ncbi:MAG: methyltransferase [Oscillospiraceae bacterium]|jgi:tRNA1Val (adenine37-N6)-methyltransferase|nr:methyltransferase [Oscillospiraceae bacterium]MDD3260556.1 methyltransferase [Oscillospiraceae bacterium]
MQLQYGERLEPIGGGRSVIVSQQYRFTTDTILLADYSMPQKGEHCAELGTGCGLVPLLWCSRGAPAEVYALEIQPQACEMARRSAAGGGFSQIHVLQYDLRKIRQEKAADLPLPLGLDLVACNPPYQPRTDGCPSPQESLAEARHELSCTFAEVAEAAARLLRWRGRFVCCLRPQRMPEAFAALSNAGLEPKRMRLVQHRLQKAPSLFLLEARRGGRPGLKVEPVLLMEDATGAVSHEMEKIYGPYREGKY